MNAVKAIPVNRLDHIWSIYEQRAMLNVCNTPALHAMFLFIHTFCKFFIEKCN